MMKHGIMVAVLGAFLASGCAGSDVVARIEQRVGTDLERTSAIAEKYGKPEVKKCSDFLLATLRSNDGAKAKLDALLAEPTDGILSSALKAALIAEIGKALVEGNRTQFETDFKANCNAVAGDIMLTLLKDAAKVGAQVR